MNRKIGLGIGVVLIAVLLLSSVFIVREGQYKVVLMFGEAVKIYKEPGLKFRIPFLQDVQTLPKYQMTYDSSPTQILTKDKKPIMVDNYTVWRISDPQKFLQTAQTVAAGEKRIDEAVYNTVRRKLSEIDYGSIISENTARGNINDQIT